MTVYVNDFWALRNGYIAIASDSGDIIAPVGIVAILKYFFDVKSYLSTKSASRYKCYVSEKEHLFIEGHFIASDISSAMISSSMSYNDYVLLTVDVEFRASVILVVLRKDDSELVGVISSGHGTQSSTELSKLIVSSPEIEWAV